VADLLTINTAMAAWLRQQFPAAASLPAQDWSQDPEPKARWRSAEAPPQGKAL
jgi:hypothetical protein